MERYCIWPFRLADNVLCVASKCSMHLPGCIGRLTARAFSQHAPYVRSILSAELHCARLSIHQHHIPTQVRPGLAGQVSTWPLMSSRHWCTSALLQAAQDVQRRRACNIQRDI